MADIAHNKRTFTDAGSHFEVAINFQGLARRPMSQMKETRKYFLVVSLGVLISSTVWSLCGLCLIGTNRVALFGKLLIDSCQKLKRHPDIHGSIHIYERLRVTKKSSSMDPALLQSVLKLQFPEYSIHM